MILFLGRLSAQEEKTEGRFGLALVLGLNASQLDGDRLRGFNKLGFRAGLRATTFLSGNKSLGIEFLFSQKGSVAEFQLGVPTDGLFRIHLNYIEVPFYFNYREWQIDFYGGLSYGRLISSTVDEGITGYASEDFRKDDLNVLLGANYLFNDTWSASLRYTRSVVNLFDNPAKNINSLNSYLFSLQINYSI